MASLSDSFITAHICSSQQKSAARCRCEAAIALDEDVLVPGEVVESVGFHSLSLEFLSLYSIQSRIPFKY